MAGTQHQNGKGADPEHRVGRLLVAATQNAFGETNRRSGSGKPGRGTVAETGSCLPRGGVWWKPEVKLRPERTRSAEQA